MTRLFPDLQIQFLVLAYAGVLLHILTRLAELKKAKKNTSIKAYCKDNIYTIIATAIMTPLLLIMATDSSIKELLPINNVTAVLAGWQTQSVFRSIMALAKKKAAGGQDNPTENPPTDNPQ